MNIAQPDRKEMAIYYETMLELSRLKFKIARQEIIDIALDRDHWKRNYNQIRYNLVSISDGDYSPADCKRLIDRLASQRRALELCYPFVAGNEAVRKVLNETMEMETT